ncbi:MAG: hypothetical protein LHV68_02295 [Elusimicrobia bacterium]|nr:hypothetical protein [Candidatus Liberimonas magnetica]
MNMLLYITILISFTPFQAFCYLWPYLLLSIIILKSKFILKVDKYSLWFVKWVLIFYAYFIFSFTINYSYINNLVAAISTYGSFFMTLLAVFLIDIEKVNYKGIFKFFVFLTLIQVPVGYYQMVAWSGFKTLNPFVMSLGAGDNFAGTLFTKWNSHILGVKLSMLFFMMLPVCLFRKTLKNISIAVLGLSGWFLPSGMHSIASGFIVIFLYTAFEILKNALVFTKIKKIYLFFVLAGICIFAVLYVMQKENIDYSINLIAYASNSVISESAYVPRKVIAYKSTLLNLPEELPSAMLFGVGPGNYSSRASAIVSGNYLVHQPKVIPVTPSYYAKKYIMPLWPKYSADGVANQPYSTWLSIYGELGFIGMFMVIILFIKLIKTLNSYSKIESAYDNKAADGLVIFTLYLVILFLFDNWLEYPQFIMPYAVFAALIIKKYNLYRIMESNGTR